jgi:hypothetical protein
MRRGDRVVAAPRVRVPGGLGAPVIRARDDGDWSARGVAALLGRLPSARRAVLLNGAFPFVKVSSIRTGPGRVVPVAPVRPHPLTLSRGFALVTRRRLDGELSLRAPVQADPRSRLCLRLERLDRRGRCLDWSGWYDFVVPGPRRDGPVALERALGAMEGGRDAWTLRMECARGKWRFGPRRRPGRYRLVLAREASEGVVWLEAVPCRGLWYGVPEATGTRRFEWRSGRPITGRQQYPPLYERCDAWRAGSWEALLDPSSPETLIPIDARELIGGNDPIERLRIDAMIQAGAFGSGPSRRRG